ncbi:MAG: hypothetical protein HOV80_29440 [Polyangiaceae bacterium]|nr:hypothetical protein [Polyangiaceae bacterium]
MPEPKPLSWSLKQKLLAKLREDFVRHGRSEALPELLEGSLADLAKTARSEPLRLLVREGIAGRKLKTTLKAWLKEMPDVHRSAWLVDKLTHAAGLVWAEPAADVPGPIRLPRAERTRIEQRLQELWETSIDRHDSDPEPEEYADVLEEEIERIGRKHEVFAQRALGKRFSHPSAHGEITLLELLNREQIDSAESVIRFLEKALEIEWTQPKGAGTAIVEMARPERPVTAYAPTTLYAAGDRIQHPRFGLGVVVSAEPGRLRARFDDGERVLAMGRGP